MDRFRFLAEESQTEFSHGKVYEPKPKPNLPLLISNNCSYEIVISTSVMIYYKSVLKKIKKTL